MISASFIFRKKQFDDAFHQLDAVIATYAPQTSGYLGEESWSNQDNGQLCNVYYWESMEGLQQLMQHPAHLDAKAAQANWLDGYQIIISEVLRSYGDGGLLHPSQAVQHHPHDTSKL